jgi:hypothetical protein
MRLILPLVLLISCLMISCSKEREHAAEIPFQTFDVNPLADTVLTTNSGVRILIKACSLQGAKGKSVKIRAKEIVSLDQLMRSRVSTIDANGNPLATAGMVYLDAADGVKINPQCPILVAIPAKGINPDMRCYEGIEDSDGNLVWQNPDTLAFQKEVIQPIAQGKALFMENCAMCHDSSLCDWIGKTGPALGCIEGDEHEGVLPGRRSREWLIEFTKEPNKMINKGDPVALCMWDKYKPTLMSGFGPNAETNQIDHGTKPTVLSDEQINLIYDYIKERSAELDLCNCKSLSNTRDYCQHKPKKPKKKLNLDTSPGGESDGNRYYVAPVQDWGWTNVDRILDPIDKVQNLEVIASREDVSVNLILPEFDIQLSLTDMGGGVFRFKSNNSNGKVPLPIGADAVLLARTWPENPKQMYQIIRLNIGQENLPQKLQLQASTEVEIRNALNAINEEYNPSEESWEGCDQCPKSK